MHGLFILYDHRLCLYIDTEIGYILPANIPPSQLTQKYIEKLKELL